jgi:hypothetical protein
MGCAQYTKSFTSNLINGKMLLTLTENDLEKHLGITSPLHRRRLLLEITNLQKQNQTIPIPIPTPTPTHPVSISPSTPLSITQIQSNPVPLTTEQHSSLHVLPKRTPKSSMIENEISTGQLPSSEEATQKAQASTLREKTTTKIPSKMRKKQIKQEIQNKIEQQQPNQQQQQQQQQGEENDDGEEENGDDEENDEK